jgi:hypothetical protein
VLHLELAAIHLEDVLFAPVQHFSQGFDGLRLAGPGRAQQQEDADRPPFRGKASLEHLDIGNDDARGRRLPHNTLGQDGCQVLQSVRGLLAASILAVSWFIHPALRLDCNGGGVLNPAPTPLLGTVWLFHTNALSGFKYKLIPADCRAIGKKIPPL